MEDKQFLWQVFQRVDLDKSGYISSTELQQSLLNGSWEPFNLETCRLMIKMFDKEKKGMISFQDFGALWNYITEWQNCFRGFDKDNSGSINNHELLTALQTFGMKFPLKTVDVIIKRFEKGTEGNIFLDDFIHCCVILQNITNGFKKLDPYNRGEINVKYEDFVELIFEAGL
ncbi:programmed cell death protein 6-like [Macrosteles quadrilineatus]|uniref:programmed cell death protein 6-like n=1 Tax=Macrosteles quadrilineatus TaxID=74068 RepID=UPI0023E1E9D0|nr:programmed cell death protein 6-like [Macrosteles quadrilineatus]XP_054268159.1 programmed cell death protein 6-like [Macrosteles quadrilineatus]